MCVHNYYVLMLCYCVFAGKGPTALIPLVVKDGKLAKALFSLHEH